MKILRTLSLAFAFLVPVTALASPAVRAVRAEAPCCPGDCCDNCPFCPNR